MSALRDISRSLSSLGSCGVIGFREAYLTSFGFSRSDLTFL